MSRDILNAFKPAESVTDGRGSDGLQEAKKQHAVGAANGYLDEPGEYEDGNCFKGYVER